MLNFTPNEAATLKPFAATADASRAASFTANDALRTVAAEQARIARDVAAQGAEPVPTDYDDVNEWHAAARARSAALTTLVTERAKVDGLIADAQRRSQAASTTAASDDVAFQVAVVETIKRRLAARVEGMAVDAVAFYRLRSQLPLTEATALEWPAGLTSQQLGFGIVATTISEKIEATKIPQPDWSAIRASIAA